MEEKKNIKRKKKSDLIYPVAENSNILRESSTSYRVEMLRHKNTLLFKGNSLDKKLFDKEFIDLIVTSPPYNVGIEYKSNNDELSYEHYLEFSENWMRNCFLWSKPQARFLLNIPLDKNKGGQKSVGADLTHIAQKVGWKYHSTIIWNEGNISRRKELGKYFETPIVEFGLWHKVVF